MTQEQLSEDFVLVLVKSDIDAPARLEDPIWLTLDQESEKSLLLLKDKTFRILDANKNRKRYLF